MYFTNNEQDGFRSADDCFQSWAKVYNGSVDEDNPINSLFSINPNKSTPDSPAKKGAWQRKIFSLIVYEYLEVNEVYLKLEDAYSCSGMCKPSLFYFGKDLDQGPPEQTCLKHFKELLSNESRAFAISSVLCGVTALFIFLTHCGLYSRPPLFDDVVNEISNPHIMEPGGVVDVNEIEVHDRNAGQVM